MSPSGEIALILACLQSRYNPGDHNDLKASAGGVAWAGVLSIARRHGIVPLVHVSLSAGQAQLPESVESDLRREFHESAANMFLHAAELLRLLNRLTERDIPALALKGPALAALLYGKLSLRTVRDLDILVDKNQVGPALDILRACGYAPVAGVEGAGPSVSGKLRKHILLTHQEAGFSVELHWAVADPSFALELSFEKLWVDRQIVMVLDQPVATPGNEDALLMMCAHGTSHCWGSLKWICDIAQAVSVQPGLDWSRILVQAHGFGCSRMLFLGLALARELCGVSLPEELEPGVNSEKVVRLSREVKSAMFVEKAPLVNLERTLTFIRSRERFRDRIRIALRFIAPELRPNARDRALVRLPDSLQFLYSPFRLVRVLLFCWKRAILPILRTALDSPRFRDWAASPPK
ncbi:MAG TPA: nucleotidyltransferase family protein [Bryobacteraceae bacterium]